MTVFADSSALVKRYADESGADQVRSLPFLVVSALARVEVPAALWRKSRTGQLSAEHAGILCAAFEAEWVDNALLVAVAAVSAVLDDAARLVAGHGLRAYDAVQLASALAARRADDQVDGFACYDIDLRAAAAREGFELVV